MAKKHVEFVVDIKPGPSDAPSLRVGDAIKVEGGMRFTVERWDEQEMRGTLLGPKGGSAELRMMPRGGWRIKRAGDWSKPIAWRSRDRVCPMCNTGVLYRTRRTEEISVSRKLFHVDVDCDCCGSCHESLVSHAEMRRAHLYVASELVRDGCDYKGELGFTSATLRDREALRFVLKALDLKPSEYQCGGVSF